MSEDSWRTHRLELDDQTLRDWDAAVLDAGPEGIVLDRSAFYPGGGGQPPDHGVLLWGGVQTRITGVRKGDATVALPILAAGNCCANLAVGDLAFQHKCLKRIAQFKADGCTIILVSHDTGLVAEMCDEALWLNPGRVMAHGPADEVVRRYIAEAESPEGAPSTSVATEVLRS